jgi:hypothetical protein
MQTASAGKYGPQSRPQPAFHRRRRRRRLVFACAVLALLVVPSTVSAAATVVSVEFDDGSQSQYQVRPMLAGHGMHGTFYINSAEVGTSSYYMTWNQLHDLAADGNEIGGHTLTHVNLPDLPADQQRTQICDDRANLLGQGFSPVVSFAYPYGRSTPVTKSIVQGCGYTTGRDAGGLGCCGYPLAETIPPQDSFGTRTPAAISSLTSLAAMESYVTQVEQHGGGWVQIVFHLICDGCDPLSIKASQLSAFLDWLEPRAATGTVVKTVADVAATRPPVGGQAGRPALHKVRAGPGTLARTTARSKAKRALRRRYGRHYTRARARRLSCDRLGPGAYRCRFSFRYRKKRRSGTVLVRVTTKGIKTKISLEPTPRGPSGPAAPEIHRRS